MLLIKRPPIRPLSSWIPVRGLWDSSYGGFELIDPSNLNNPTFGNTVLYPASSKPGISGSQLYSLTGNSPTFNLGTYNSTDVAYGGSNPVTLVISTPEPSALVLLLIGLFAAAVTVGFKKVIT
jgi:hypothetical protein